jgi:hypothetical protein
LDDSGKRGKLDQAIANHRTFVNRIHGGRANQFFYPLLAANNCSILIYLVFMPLLLLTEFLQGHNAQAELRGLTFSRRAAVSSSLLLASSTRFL